MSASLARMQHLQRHLHIQAGYTQVLSKHEHQADQHQQQNAQRVDPAKPAGRRVSDGVLTVVLLRV